MYEVREHGAVCHCLFQCILFLYKEVYSNIYLTAKLSYLFLTQAEDVLYLNRFSRSSQLYMHDKKSHFTGVFMETG